MLYYAIIITSFPFKPTGSISYNNIATVNIEINYIILFLTMRLNIILSTPKFMWWFNNTLQSAVA